MRFHMPWAALVLSMFTAAVGAATYEVTDVAAYRPPDRHLGRLDNIGINRAGWVVGTIHTQDGDRAFIYRDGSLEILGTLGGATSQGAAINQRGDVAGFAERSECCAHAFLWNGVDMKNLGVLKGKFSIARGINRSREVVGFGYDKASRQHAFVHRDGQMSDLGTLGGSYSDAYAINDAGQVAGWAMRADGQGRAFLHEGGVMRDLGALTADGHSAGVAINESGDVVGNSSVEEFGPSHAALFSGGTVTDLGTLGGAYSAALGINDKGDIVGWSTGSGTRYKWLGRKAFLYRQGHMIALTHRLDPVTGAGWTLQVATGINDSGQIVGWGRHDGKYRIFLLTPLRD